MFKTAIFSMILYVASLIVVNVDHGIVTLRSGLGIEYEIEEAEAWKVGDPAVAIIFNNYTSDPSDDVIGSIRYTGWRHLHD